MAENPQIFVQTMEQRRHDMAMMFANAKMIQFLLGVVAKSKDDETTRMKIVAIEEAITHMLRTADFFPGVSASDKENLAEEAAHYASRLLSGIQP